MASTGYLQFLKTSLKKALAIKKSHVPWSRKAACWLENILSVQTTRGGRRRGGQGRINTAGFNIRNKDRHFAPYCGTCFGNQMKHMRTSTVWGCVWVWLAGWEGGLGGLASLHYRRAVVTASSPSPSCQHSWFSLIVKVPLFAEGSTSSLPHKNHPEFKLQL